jgi:hypothetical protein
MKFRGDGLDVSLRFVCGTAHDINNSARLSGVLLVPDSGAAFQHTDPDVTSDISPSLGFLVRLMECIIDSHENCIFGHDHYWSLRHILKRRAV